MAMESASNRLYISCSLAQSDTSGQFAETLVIVASFDQKFSQACVAK